MATDPSPTANPPAELLRVVAAAERGSEHPLAEAIVRHADGLGVGEGLRSRLRGQHVGFPPG